MSNAAIHTERAKGVARGKAPGPSIAGPVPEQARTSRPPAPLAWWESEWGQLGAMALPALVSASYLAAAFGAALARLVLKRSYAVSRPAVGRMRRPALWLAGAGLAAVLGFVAYFGFVMFTAAGAVGPVVAGRPLPWLALQGLSVATCVFAALLAASWWSGRGALTAGEKAGFGVLLFGGALFVPRALYWGLLVP